jgi:hypothetical protein
MARIIDKQIYHINSANRISGTDENLTIELNDYGRDWTHVVVLDAAIPLSYYNIRDGENSFTLREDVTDYTITIPAANYNRKNLATVLQNLLNAAGAYDYTITVPNTTTSGDTGKYTYTVTNNGGIQPAFIFTDALICQQLGFDFNSTNTFVGDSLVSVNVTNLASEDNIYIRSNVCSNRDSNVLQHIIANTSSFSNVIFENKSPDYYKKVYNPARANIYQFWITDEFSRTIALNGVNWVATIALLNII